LAIREQILSIAFPFGLLCVGYTEKIQPIIWSIGSIKKGPCKHYKNTNPCIGKEMNKGLVTFLKIRTLYKPEKIAQKIIP
jgi:hypothetical protein